jgi:hypothetical protein
MKENLVAHVEGAHELQDGDLQWEVEGSDEADGAVGPAHAVAHLSLVVARHGEAAREKADLVAAKVLQKLLSHNHLADRLPPTLGRRPLDQPGKVIANLQ